MYILLLKSEVESVEQFTKNKQLVILSLMCKQHYFSRQLSFNITLNCPRYFSRNEHEKNPKKNHPRYNPYAQIRI